MPRAFEYRHVVGFEDTNLVGNVYYVNHLRWQGRCREMFLRQYAPELLDQLRSGLSLVTVSCSCEYLGEAFAFDQILIRMTLGELQQSRVTMSFEYWRAQDDGREQLIARGRQQVACMRSGTRGLEAAPWPEALREAIQMYAD
jgi:enediyne biosynthesis thioesterase